MPICADHVMLEPGVGRVVAVVRGVRVRVVLHWPELVEVRRRPVRGVGRHLVLDLF